VGEHRPRDAVADRPHASGRRAEQAVNRHIPALVGLDADDLGGFPTGEFRERGVDGRDEFFVVENDEGGTSIGGGSDNAGDAGGFVGGGRDLYLEGGAVALGPATLGLGAGAGAEKFVVARRGEDRNGGVDPGGGAEPFAPLGVAVGPVDQIAGMKRRGPSVYSILKKEGFTGTRAEILEQINKQLEN
jgi:hypothetical protein